MGKLKDIFKGKNNKYIELPNTNGSEYDKLENTIQNISKKESHIDNDLSKNDWKMPKNETSKDNLDSNLLFWDKKDKPFKKQYYKKIEDKKMVIILLEDSLDSKVYENAYKNSLKRIVADNLYTIVYYNELNVIIGDCIEDKKEDELRLRFESPNPIGGKLYDGIKEVNNLVSEYLEKDLEGIECNFHITSVDVLGIGNAIDINSKLAEKHAIYLLHSLNTQKNVNTKYICINANGIISAARIGFRSIGCMDTSY